MFKMPLRWAGFAMIALGAGLWTARSAWAVDLRLQNQQQTVVAHTSDGSWEIFNNAQQHTVIHVRSGAELNHRWISCSDYPTHPAVTSSFKDALGTGQQITMRCTGLSGTPDLEYRLRLYQSMPAGTISVTVLNSTSATWTVQDIRPVESIGQPAISTGESEHADRILSDSFSEDWPPLKIEDFDQAPDGVLRAVGSQLIENRTTHTSLFFGALSSDRFLTIMHWKLGTNGSPGNYTVDSTGTTEIQSTDPESGLRDGPKKNLVELSLPLAPGAGLPSESLMFATTQDYFSTLDHYGAAIRTLHHGRSSGPMLGWWSWTAYYSRITQGNASTNAEWLAQNLERLGFDYFHLDLGYAYARGEYATPNAAQFPMGLLPLSGQVCHLGLRLGLWTAPFEVSDRSWVYQHHKDWLVHNAAGEPIQIGVGDEAGKEILFVLDTTNPNAQDYLRSTYRTLTRDWGAQYIKLDFMDNTAIEGYYYRPNTTALEAQRIGLEIIRDAVGDHVLLDKDGSPMLNPVGLVDEGRLSQDTGHTFERSKEAAPGIAARYYMNHNFFLSDPDAFTVSQQMIEERKIRAPLTFDEAEVSIALAAVSGGMLEIGDDLPILGSEADRLALVENPDLLQMVRLGRAALPLDLLTYRTEDEQPSIFLLREDRRESVLAVFNWTEQPRSHTFARPELRLAADDHYRLVDAFDSHQPPAMLGNQLSIGDQPPHSVRLIKIIDDSVAPEAPTVVATIPAHAKIGEAMHFSASANQNGVPAVSYLWDFGDGVTATGEQVNHTFTHAGSFAVTLSVNGADGVPYREHSALTVHGTQDVAAPERYDDGSGAKP